MEMQARHLLLCTREAMLMKLGCKRRTLLGSFWVVRNDLYSLKIGSVSLQKRCDISHCRGAVDISACTANRHRQRRILWPEAKRCLELLSSPWPVTQVDRRPGLF